MNSPNLLSSDEAFDFSSDDSFKDPDFQQSTSNARKHKSGNESFHIEEKKIKGETKFLFNNDFFQLAKQMVDTETNKITTIAKCSECGIILKGSGETTSNFLTHLRRGGGKYKQLQLSPLEEAVANLMQFEKQLTPAGVECGVKDQGLTVLEGEEKIPEKLVCAPLSSNVGTEELLPLEESFAHHQPGNISNLANERDWFMECIEDVAPESSSSINSHSKTQKKSQRHTEKRNSTERLYKKISRTMISIKNTLKDKNKMQEEKLQLLRRQDERQEQLFQNEMEIKRIELEIKKKELQHWNGKA